MSVLSVSVSTSHSFGKTPATSIYLLSNAGVQGDIHCSSSPSSSNLRQVQQVFTEFSLLDRVNLTLEFSYSIIDSSLFSNLAKPSSEHPSLQLSPGSLGENITTQNIDLVSLSEGTRLHFGEHAGHAVVRVTGLRNPKKRLDEWPKGLLDRCKLKDKKGNTVGRKVGVMGVVESEGYVQPGYVVYIEKPKHFKPLGNV